MGNNLLFFHLEIDFGEDIKFIFNNEVDLQEYLVEKGYSNIKFSDLETSYGTCQLKDMYGNQTAKCFYIKKI
jgi:hypothetical protein